jgi:hypothetical protein
MEYLTTREAAKLWGIAVRQVQGLCEKGRVPGAVHFGREWAIPKSAGRPPDERHLANGAYPSRSAFPPPPADRELFERIVRCFPYPVHIAASDGTLVTQTMHFINSFRYPAMINSIKSITFFSTLIWKNGE